jgi:hypothetical protein
MPHLIKGHLRFTEEDNINNDFYQKNIQPLKNNDNENLMQTKIKKFVKNNNKLMTTLLANDPNEEVNKNTREQFKKTFILFNQIASLSGYSLNELMQED